MKKVLSIILCAVIAASCGTFSAGAKAVAVKSPKLYSVVQTDLKTAKISWSKVKGARGYVLYYSTNGRSYKRAVTTTKRYYIHRKLTDNKKYYYKVRAYKRVNGRTKYSRYSNIRTIRIKNDLLAIYKPYRAEECTVYNGNDKFYMSGNSYRYGLVIRNEGYACFNLKGKYRYIKFTYGDIALDDETTLEIKADDETVAEYKIKPGDIEKTVKVDIENANKLAFEKSYTFWGSPIGIANIKLYK